MEIIMKQTEDLQAYKYNPRDNDNAVDVVAESIKEFGFKVPIIIDREGVIIAGHTRLRAAKRLGIREVPCIVADDLTPEQIKAFRLADNKTSEFAEWDFAALERELEELTAFDVDMSKFGFDEVFGEDAEEEEEEKPEIEFVTSLEENHNYIVLYFDKDIDWLQAQSVFDLKSVKEYSTRKDGAIKKEKRGVGRIISGAEVLSKMTGGLFGEN